MKQRYFYLTIFATLMATFVTGCKKEEGTVTLGAVIQKPADNKVYIDDHTPCWHNGDEVYINTTAYPIMAATGATARIENVISSSAYRAIFPASIIPDGTDISNSSSIPVTLPATQQYQLVGSHQLVDVPMGAYITSGSTLQFYNLCSIVRVIVSNSLNQDLPLRSIELQTQTAKLSGAGTATVSGQASDCITLSSNARNSVNLAFTNDCPATVEARGTSTFDIVVPAFTTNNVTISLYTTDGYMFSLPKEGVSLEQNTITTVTLNVTSLTLDSHAELVDGPTFNAAIPDNATSIVFEYNSSVTSGTLLSTNDSPVPIYGNLDGTMWRVSTSDITMNANPNSSGMFSSHYNSEFWLLNIDFGTGFNTENVTNMSGMFEGCYFLTADLSIFNTENVTNMSRMFKGCDISNFDLSGLNTENVTDMSEMFYGCDISSNLDFSNFNTENVTNMSGMFSGCFGDLDLSGLNTENVTDMSEMFYGCDISNPDFSTFNTENVTDMSEMFYGCDISNLDLSNFNTENVTNMSEMFSGCVELTSLNLSSFNTENVTNMRGMFAFINLTSLDLSSFNTENVTNMSEMFQMCWYLTSLNLSNFDMSNVSSKSDMCSGLSGGTRHCTITCPLAVQIELMTGNTEFPDSEDVTITWVRP